MADTGSPLGPLSGGCFTAIVTPQGTGVHLPDCRIVTTSTHANGPLCTEATVDH